MQPNPRRSKENPASRPGFRRDNMRLASGAGGVPPRQARQYPSRTGSRWSRFRRATAKAFPETSKGWNLRTNCWTEAGDVQQHTGNIGLAHGYSGTAALDVDSYTAAVPALSARGVDLNALLTADDAVQIRSGRPDRAKLLYRLPAGVAQLPSVDRTDAGEGFEFRCGTKDGFTVQDVLPPSYSPRHRASPYEWGGAGDLARLAENCRRPDADVARIARAAAHRQWGRRMDRQRRSSEGRHRRTS